MTNLLLSHISLELSPLMDPSFCKPAAAPPPHSTNKSGQYPEKGHNADWPQSNDMLSSTMALAAEWRAVSLPHRVTRAESGLQRQEIPENYTFLGVSRNARKRLRGELRLSCKTPPPHTKPATPPFPKCTVFGAWRSGAAI